MSGKHRRRAPSPGWGCRKDKNHLNLAAARTKPVTPPTLSTVSVISRHQNSAQTRPLCTRTQTSSASDSMSA